MLPRMMVEVDTIVTFKRLLDTIEKFERHMDMQGVDGYGSRAG